MQFHCPKNPIFYHEKRKSLCQMTYTIGRVWPRQFFKPGFEVSRYFDLGARLISMQWPPYYAHILQGLKCNLALLWGMIGITKSGIWDCFYNPTIKPCIIMLWSQNCISAIKWHVQLCGLSLKLALGFSPNIHIFFKHVFTTPVQQTAVYCPPSCTFATSFHVPKLGLSIYPKTI